MPKKNLPEITDYLDEFVDKLLYRIADESEQGRISLIATMITAQKLYNQPVEAWSTGWFYQFFRIRGQEIEDAIASIEAYPDAYDRLQELKILVEKGEWSPDSSYNYFLFVELIKSVPGYKPLEKELVHPITIKVKNKIIVKIDHFIAEYKANQKLIESRQKELEAAQQSVKKSVDNILIFNNLESAQASAKENPAKIHFSLTCKNKLWQLSWVDFAGKAYALDIGDELITTLVEHEILDVKNEHSEQARRLKLECSKARDVFLEKVQLLVNPKEPASHAEINNASLISEGLTATFILRGKANAYSLYWVSTLGKINEISLEKYPQFQKWLNAQNPLGEEQIPQLKAYLFNINTASSLNAVKGMDEFKSELQACFRQGPKTATPVSSFSVKSDSSKPKHLDLKLFDKLDKCLEKNKSPVTKSIMNPAAEGGFKETTSVEVISEKKLKGRLNLKEYGAVATLFANRLNNKTESVEEIKPTSQNH